MFSQEKTQSANETSALLINGKVNYYQHDYESNYVDIIMTNKDQQQDKNLQVKSYNIYTRYIIWSIIVSVMLITIVLLTNHHQFTNDIQQQTRTQSVLHLNKELHQYNNYLNLSIIKDHTGYSIYDLNLIPNNEGKGSKTTKSLLVQGSYDLNLNHNGWNYLSINAVDSSEWTTESEVHTYIRTMQAVGLLEGFTTCNEMKAWYANFYDGLFDGKAVTDDSLRYLESNFYWMQEQADRYYQVDDYWLTVKGLLSQLEGMLVGAQLGCPFPLLYSTTSSTNNHNNIQSNSKSNIKKESIFQAHQQANHRSRKNYYNDIYLPSIGDEGNIALIHLLLMNSNGDLFQIIEKFQNTDDDDDDDSTNSNNRHGNNDLPDNDDFAYAYFNNANHSDLYLDDDYSNNLDGYEADNPLIPHSANTNPSSLSLLQRASSKDTVLTESERKQVRALRNLGTDHCSVIIKLLEDGSDVVFAHNTWDNYQNAAPRIFKHYHYPLIKDGRVLKDTMFDTYFSSSPGLLSSVDDFYINYGKSKAGMAVTETSLDMYDPDIFSLIVPESMLCWVRVGVANQMAVSGKDWATLFSRHHSGTYANQWMVLDFNFFNTPEYGGLQSGFFTVLEELPGIMVYDDLTSVLKKKSYWASYNSPYFPEIAVRSGNTAKCYIDSTYCHELDPRANIFRVQHKYVDSIGDMQKLIQLNHYKSDPFSKSDSCKAIACREDLEPKVSKREPFGAIDAKVEEVSSVQMSIIDKNLLEPIPPMIYVKLGPTNDDNPAFCWSAFEQQTLSTSGRVYSHVGHPDCFDFHWQTMPPQ